MRNFQSHLGSDYFVGREFVIGAIQKWISKLSELKDVYCYRRANAHLVLIFPGRRIGHHYVVFSMIGELKVLSLIHI